MFGKKKKQQQEKKIFVDLADIKEPMYAQSDAKIKVIEITSMRDLKPITDMAYRGNILILDFSRFAEGDATKREIAKRLQEISKDISGAFTEVSDRLMVLSPSGLNIEKSKIVHRENRDV